MQWDTRNQMENNQEMHFLQSKELNDKYEIATYKED